MDRLPTYENCQPLEGGVEDPARVFEWAFTSLPFKGSTPLMVHPEARGEWSQLFWDLGFRHHPELQTKKLRSPYRGQHHALNGSVQVVDIDEPDHPPVVIPDVDEYTPTEQELIAEQLRHRGFLQTQAAEPAKAQVVSGPKFDPGAHSPSAVNGYLMGMEAAGNKGEMRRVIAAEMVGKKRDQVLRKWPGV